MIRFLKVSIPTLIIMSCVPQGGGELVDIPEVSEYMRGYFPLEVVFDNKNPNQMIVLLSSGATRQFKLLSISMPVGQRVWEYTASNKVIRYIYPDPEGGVWAFVEQIKMMGRRSVRDFKLVKVENGKEIASVDLPDTMYTDWYTFTTEAEKFIGKPVMLPIRFTVCNGDGSIDTAFPIFKNLKEFYEAFQKTATKPNFKKYIISFGDEVMVVSETLDSMWIYDVKSGEVLKGIKLGEPQIIPRGGGKAVIMNRVVAVGKKGDDTLWVLTLKDIRYFDKNGQPVMKVDFGDKRFLTGTVRNDTFYWITYEKTVRLAPITRYNVVKIEGG